MPIESRKRFSLVCAALLLAALLSPAAAQDIRGLEVCTAEKQMERRTGCLQANAEFLQQELGIKPMLPRTIARHVAGTGRIRQQRALRRIHLREPLLIRPLETAKGIVPGGIQDDFLRRFARLLDPF